LHVLKEEGGATGLVRDDETLRRVALRIEILRRALEGELVEWAREDGAVSFLGVFHRGTTSRGPYRLAADLVDPATVVAFEMEGERLARVADDRTLLEIRGQLDRACREWDIDRPNLEAAVRGLRPEPVEVADPEGRRRRGRAVCRLSFEGRDVVFLAFDDDPARAAVAIAREGGRLEWISDEGLLGRLRGHLESLRG
jgi:hypothetical protein